MRTSEINPQDAWRAVEARDSSQNGVFYYGVKSTGVYCLPSCSSKTPNQENVEFFNSCDDAEQSGYRPCKRCKPDSFSQKSVIEFATWTSPIGEILVARTAQGICALFLGDDAAQLERDLVAMFPDDQVQKNLPSLAADILAVTEHIESPKSEFSRPLDPRGTEFQKAIWNELRKIPVGSAITYSRLASNVGAPGAVRAVARACATNPIAILIPCHRVIRSDGTLAGYRWGVERKLKLLERELQLPFLKLDL
ncbi:MAG: methylated-DNA--[protein]-cysteine S-methyltransferase [Fimbriimonadales bacterium]